MLETTHDDTRLREGRPGRGGPAGEARSVRDLSARELGMRGEETAARNLVSRGWVILERNYRCAQGEADIVALEREGDETVVLVEVKTRLALGGDSEVVPELAVDAGKQARYRAIALSYLGSHGQFKGVRFDVIALTVKGEGVAGMRHLKAAYSVDG